MADSIREKILANIVTTLEGISTGGGYNNTINVGDVKRSNQGVPNVLKFPSLILSVEDTPLNVASQDIVTRQMTATITINAGPSSTTLAKKIETYIADVVRAMAADPTRGSNGCTQGEPTIEEPEFSEAFQDHAVVAVVFPIMYQVNRTNPNLAA